MAIDLKAFINSKLNDFSNYVNQKSADALFNLNNDTKNILERVHSLPQQFDALGQLLNQGYRDNLAPNIPAPVNNYIQNRVQYYNQNPLSKVFNPSQFNSQNLGNTLGQLQNNINQKVLGFGPNGELPALPPTLGGGIEDIFANSISNAASHLAPRILPYGSKLAETVAQQGKLLSRDFYPNAGSIFESGFARDPKLSFENTADLGASQGLRMNPTIPSNQMPEFPKPPLPTSIGLNEQEKQTFDNIFARWVGSKNAAETKGLAVGNRFTNIPTEKGFTVVDAIEHPERVNNQIEPYVRGIKQTYDQLFDEAKRSGLDVGYLKNYITHIWQESPEQVQLAFRSAGQRFKFSQDRVVPTYELGINLGLHPKYTQPSQILSEYVRRLETTKANLDLVRSLIKEGLVVKSGGNQVPGMVPIVGPGFPSSVTGTPLGEQSRELYYGLPEVASLLNKVFSPQTPGTFENIVSGARKASSVLQDVTLSGGLPGTPINAFTLAQLQKELTAGRVVSPLKSLLISLHPNATKNFFQRNLGQIAKMQEMNIPVSHTVNIENLIGQETFSRMFGGGVKGNWNRLINDPTFQRYIPMLQVQFFNDVERSALTAGKNPAEAAQIAGKATKNFYGIVGSDAIIKRNQIGQDIMGTLLFAPKYRESMINFWINNVKALSNPFATENIHNTRFILGSAVTLGIMNELNKRFNNGRNMWDNPPGLEDKLLIPTEDGTTIGVPFLSSIATIPRAVARQGLSIAQGNLSQAFKDALQTYSSTIGRPVGDILANQDYFGRKIVADNATTGEKYLQIGAYLAKSFNHPYIRELLNVYGHSLPESMQKSLGIPKDTPPLYQTLSTAFELPIRYYNSKSLDSRYFFAAKDEVLKTLSPTDRAIYDKLHAGGSVDEDGLPIYNKRSEMANALDRLANPQVLKAESLIALESAKRSNQPANPFYLLTPQQQQTVLLLKTFYPGDSAKSQITKANLNWLQEYWNLRDKYISQLKDKGVLSSSGYPQSPRPSPELQNKLDQYNKLPSGIGMRTAYLRSNPDVLAYFQQSRDFTNAQRADLGLPLLANNSSSNFSSQNRGFSFKPRFKQTALKIKKVNTKKVAFKKIKKLKAKNLATIKPPKVVRVT